jgi:hypothetical protein
VYRQFATSTPSVPPKEKDTTAIRSAKWDQGQIAKKKMMERMFDWRTCGTYKLDYSLPTKFF